ncbi:MAG: hypothetical protein JXA74_04860, partial [Anaerolineae bacterium]|nr:hypothetical protein [Anaerolineae bacterium]
MRNGYGHMLLDDYVERVRAMRRERAARLAAIATPEEALAYAAAAKRAIEASFQPVPPKTPLNARITGVVERGAYRIEKLLYESRPG